MRRVVVATMVLLTGCIAEGHCPPSYNDLDWAEPGLYAAISGAEQAWVTWDAGDGALPWNGTPAWPGLRLASVDWTVPRPASQSRGMFLIEEPHVQSIGVQRDGRLVAFVDGNVTEAVLRSAFDQVMANVTRAGFDAEGAWQSFLASRRGTGSSSVFPLDEEATTWEERPQFHHSASLANGLDLDGLADRIQLPTASRADVGEARASAADWSFTFSLPSWTLSRTFDRSVAEESLRVDSSDHVLVHAAGEGTRSEEALREAAGSLLSILDRESSFPGAVWTSDVC